MAHHALARPGQDKMTTIFASYWNGKGGAKPRSLDSCSVNRARLKIGFGAARNTAVGARLPATTT